MVDKLISGIKKFSNENCNPNSEYNKEVENGQSAKILIIGCSDSLVDPITLTGAGPGEIFTHRNISGLVPPFDNDELNLHATSAVLDFAVNTLEVNDIIVLGHGFCGGIKALINNSFKHKEKSYAESWVEIIRPNLQKIIEENKEKPYLEVRELCEKEAVKTSVNNLKTFPFIQEKLNQNKITLHGWHFDRGNLSIYKEGSWNN